MQLSSALLLAITAFALPSPQLSNCFETSLTGSECRGIGGRWNGQSTSDRILHRAMDIEQSTNSRLDRQKGPEGILADLSKRSTNGPVSNCFETSLTGAECRGLGSRLSKRWNKEMGGDLIGMP